MSDDAVPTASAATPVKAAKKKAASSKPKAPSDHPQYKVMISAAITALKERRGSSRQAILKYIIANYKVGDNPTAINTRLKAALKAGVKTGILNQSKGTGAAGSFGLGEKTVKVKKEGKTKSPKKAANLKEAGEAKIPKWVTLTVKQTAAAKKPKSHKKATTAKLPKKAAAKPKAANPKVAKKMKTPKKKAAKL